MISHRCRYKARGSVLIRIFTPSSVRWAAARVTLAISSLFCFRSSPPLFYHSTRIRMMHVQADEIRVKGCKLIAWMGLAMMVSTRLWLGGVVQMSRDRSLADRLMQQVRRCAAYLRPF